MSTQSCQLYFVDCYRITPSVGVILATSCLYFERYSPAYSLCDPRWTFSEGPDLHSSLAYFHVQCKRRYQKPIEYYVAWPHEEEFDQRQEERV